MLNVTVHLFPDSRHVELERCVPRYELREGLSELFELSVEVLLRDPAFDVNDAVGQRVLVTFEDEPFHGQLEGMVRRMRQLTAEPTGASRYELFVVPALWLLTRRRDHRIFQDRSVIEIAEEVIAGYGGRVPALNNLAGAHAKREYCVQYGETDFDFLCRILADEGISFFFDHDQRLSSEPGQSRSPTSIFTLVDDTTAFSPELSGKVPLIPAAGGLLASRPHAQRVLVSSGVETSAVTLRDHDFERPLFEPTAQSKAKGELFANETDLEAYSYEAGRLLRPDAEARPAQLLEEARTGRIVYDIETSFALAPGTRLQMEGHPSESVNGGKLVVQARTRAGLDGEGKPLASHVLQCAPAHERYRPTRRPKPRIHGTHTAVVVGKKVDEDEIEVDRYGRVRVWFHWDRTVKVFEGKLSRFIRVSQAWAGAGYGMVLLPRVGDEVIVSYMDGDPDEPLIVGRVHNAVSTTPLNLANPDDYTVSIWKSRSSPAIGTEDRYNMVRMQDKSGAEELELRAQRDFHQETLHDSRTSVGHDESTTVKGRQSTSAGSISASSGSTISVDAKDSIRTKAGTSITEEAGTSIAESAGTTMSLAAGTKLDASSVTVVINGKMVTGVFAGATLYLHSGGTVGMAGRVVEIDGLGTVTVSAPAVTVQGTEVVNVKGGKVNIEGAPVTIQGGAVKVIGSTVDINGGTVKLNC